MHNQTSGRWSYTRKQVKNFFIYTVLKKHGFQLTSSWRLKKTLKVLCVQLQCTMLLSVQRLPNRLKSSRCHAYHLKFTLLGCRYALDISDFCSINSSLLVSPRDKNVSNWNQWNKQPMLLSISSYPWFQKQVLQELQTARRKCVGAPPRMNPKFVLVCRCTSCSSSRRRFHRKSW